MSSAQPSAISDVPLRGWLSSLERAAKRAGQSPEAWSNWALVWLAASLAARRGLVPSPPTPDPGPLEWLEVLRGVPGLEGARILAQDFDVAVPLAWNRKATGKCAGSLARLLDADSSVEVLGRVHERVLEWTTVGVQRRRSGSFYTPPAVCALIAARVLDVSSTTSLPSICDPAVGGGAFLLACLRRLAPGVDDRGRRLAVVERFVGVDRSSQALAVAEFSLWLELGIRDLMIRDLPARLLLGDSLDVDLNPRGNKRAWTWQQVAGNGFDLVIGNPPWVAFAGRAAQALPAGQRKRYARHFRAWRGYPTLHGLFVELATRLAPSGRVALLLPSPVADLDGYRAVREVATAKHELMLPLPELGGDAFAGVTQPSFGLLLSAKAGAKGSGSAWRLEERRSRASEASELSLPGALQRLGALPCFPEECFGERGFQSAGEISRRLFHRGNEPQGDFVIGLLEGRDVQEFHLGPTRLFLKPDAKILERSRSKLRDAQAYREVAFVVRQTATHPIAALHDGRYFRNTLLAGFAAGGLSAELLVGLLNSALYRALHVAQNRDVRQKVFPQVKIRQLRALPAPPRVPEAHRAIEDLVRRASLAPGDTQGFADLTARLDSQVFDLFSIAQSDRESVLRFLEEVAPRALASRCSAELSWQIADERDQRGEEGDERDSQ